MVKKHCHANIAHPKGEYINIPLSEVCNFLLEIGGGRIQYLDHQQIAPKK